MSLPFIDRSAYAETFEAGGPVALNELLRSRNPNPRYLEKELMRMERSGRWVIEWTDDGGYVVACRAPASRTVADAPRDVKRLTGSSVPNAGQDAS